MRLLKLLMLALLVSSEVFAQGDTLEYYMNISWKKCEPQDAFYFRRAWKENDWWRVKDYYIAEETLQMNGMYAEHAGDSFKVRQGLFLYYHPNGKIGERVNYVNDKKDGVVKMYDLDGRLEDSGFYKEGLPCKVRTAWDNNGTVIFKGIYNEDGGGIGEEWEYYSNGKLGSYGKTGMGHLKDSIWTFYHKNGVVSSVERYERDSLLHIECFDLNGKLSADSCFPFRMALPGYNVYNYLAINISYPKSARRKNIQGRVYVDFAVAEDGSITDVKTIGRHLGSGCDEEAARVVSLMPKWEPAKSHNRLIKFYCRQPVSFRLE